MTKLSVNLNKIALLRNSRGRDYPNVLDFAQKMIDLGVEGITVHPRQDERHITRQDAIDLGRFLVDSAVEYNVEGYPSEDFMALVLAIKPTQCTLVPDLPGQLTSDHGWDLTEHLAFVKNTCQRLNDAGIRSALFLDAETRQVELAAQTGAQRIELYTENYAAHYDQPEMAEVLHAYQNAAALAQRLGLGVNAGHDLDLQNLGQFLTIDGILEVSIGHALIVECIEQGMASVVAQYLALCAA